MSGPDATSPPDPDRHRTFEDLLAELEEVTDRLAGGELGIEAATELYERAESLHVLAAERLAQVQERFERRRAEGRPPTT
jgi:exodeoxyribonuclease VII small subunit